MTLLHVAAGNGYGGIERMLVTMAATAHPRLEQQFVVAFGGRLERELEAVGAAVHCLPSPRATRPLMIWRARRAFASLLTEIAPAAAIFHGAWPHAMFAAAARSAGIHIGFWQHQPIARPAWPDRWARRVRPEFIVFNSAFTQARPAFPDLQGPVIHCPVAPPPDLGEHERKRMRASLGANDGDVVILMAARLEKWKGQEVLLEAARLLRSPRVRIWIAGGAQRAGEQTYFDALSNAAAAPELNKAVTLLGERQDVPTLMRAADVYCQPNLRGEPFGIAIAEAMRAGLPCVVSAPGGAAELLDDTCAIVTTPGNAAEVAEALDRLIADAGLRAALGRSAIERASRLTDPAGRLNELETVVAAAAA